MAYLKRFKTPIWRLFGPHSQQCPNSLKLHLLHHMSDDLDLIKVVSVLIASKCEHSDLNFKHSYGSTSELMKKQTVDNVLNLHITMSGAKLLVITQQQSLISQV